MNIILFTLLNFVLGCECFTRFASVNYKATSSLFMAPKFDPALMVNVKVRKPLGISLVENEEGQKNGVCIEEIDEGSVKASGLVTPGMYLLKVNGKDVRYEDFDTILDMIIALPEKTDIEMQLIDSAKVFRGTATLKIVEPSGKVSTLPTAKGMNLRSVLMASNIDVYDVRGKVTNCGGGGSCGTCGVEILDNEGWEPRPDFEGRRLKRYSDKARLSCNTVVEGDCTVIVKPKPVL